MAKFNVTYSIVTPESAEDGDYAESGFSAEGVSLREALNACQVWPSNPRLTCSSSRPSRGDWFSAEPDLDYRTGEETTYSLHPPRNITAASFARLVRLLTQH